MRKLAEGGLGQSIQVGSLPVFLQGRASFRQGESGQFRRTRLRCNAMRQMNTGGIHHEFSSSA
jgi:hypothetical protein